ncbi:MAG: hypothetical protein BJ554DRAFT_367 [Olpidium bornovanus]|uniref:Uncharacterized protein n=1 Tax=Olpidium bornovanus TaxID=278681 RepID=A0A8H7ZTW5_9FUNG|nr:MAG: hypothetical protein BJ554DRAFT_367 [Olpidium bornovanus]
MTARRAGQRETAWIGNEADCEIYVETFAESAKERFEEATLVGRGKSRIELTSLSEVKLLAELLRGTKVTQCGRVNAGYKSVAQRVMPQATEMPVDAHERVERARGKPPLRPIDSIGHCFTPETLTAVTIGGDGWLSTQEVQLFREMWEPLGKAFAFEDDEIG